jgi:methylglutaconyl-CoA hydratase
MSEDLVSAGRHGAVAVLELDDPGSGNALSGAMIAALQDALAAVAAAEGTRAVVLAGRGRHFCAGAHLGELERLAGAPAEERLADARALGRLYAALLRCELPTVAALHGAAYGGGLGLAATCDLVVAAAETRLQFSEVRLGFVPALISVFLPRRVGPARLAELFLDPNPLDAAEARRWGLVDEVADPPLERALERAAAIAGKAAPSAIAATKRLLLESTLPRLDELLEAAARANAEQRAHPECRRGVAHFLAHRDFPRWE